MEETEDEVDCEESAIEVKSCDKAIFWGKSRRGVGPFVTEGKCRGSVTGEARRAWSFRASSVGLVTIYVIFNLNHSRMRRSQGILQQRESGIEDEKLINHPDISIHRPISLYMVISFYLCAATSPRCHDKSLFLSLIDP